MYSRRCIVGDVYDPLDAEQQARTAQNHDLATCVADLKTKEADIIDSVLDFGPASSTSADNVLVEISEHGCIITHILDLHPCRPPHRIAIRPSISIGKRITQTQAPFAPQYGVDEKHLSNAFDILFDDNATFAVGSLGAKIGTAMFTGDSIFNPDVDSACCDFPVGSATALFHSMRTLLSLPAHFRLYTGHDYPPGERGVPLPCTTVAEQNERNKHVKRGVEEAQFVQWRSERDALQCNTRGGSLPEVTEGGLRLLRVPVKVPAAMM
ncbi:uncharacterized protein K441DRAFT_690955 [Cenococcum geophilum 1.58]|uniref:uncharacterized protein n=1 Tax=Cenococcum geophilum 1.58 TaxID=794803 RepID=UPI000DC810F5|nr:hypothetical protein K441DRAFT_690955 [Cenococcum geophilum 1.58]